MQRQYLWLLDMIPVPLKQDLLMLCSVILTYFFCQQNSLCHKIGWYSPLCSGNQIEVLKPAKSKIKAWQLDPVPCATIRVIGTAANHSICIHVENCRKQGVAMQ